MTSRAEQALARSLREILTSQSATGAIAQSKSLDDFRAALERVLPATLAVEHPWWRGEAFDGFTFAIAEKVGADEAEFLGLGLLIGDQTWTPVFLRVRIAATSEAIESLTCKVGETGTGAGGIVRIPFGSEAKPLFNLPRRAAEIQWVYSIERGRSAA